MRTGILGGIFAFSFVLWFAAAPAAFATDRDAADALRTAGKYAEAIAIYEEVLKEFPDDGPTLYGLGICLTILGMGEPGPDRLQKAREVLGKLVAKVPQFAEYRHFNGFSALQLAVKLQDRKEDRAKAMALAEAEVRESIALEKDEAKKDMYASTLGQVLKEKGDFAKAKEAFAALTVKYPTGAWYFFWLGECEEALGNEQAAIEAYLKSLAADRTLLNPMSPLSRVFTRLRREGKLKEAVALLEKIVALKPNPFHHGWALKELADDRVDLGDNEGAIAALREAEEVKPDEAMFPNRMGLIFLAMGDREKAMECFRRAMEKNRLLLYPYENIGTELAALGKVEDARETYKRGIKAAEEVVASSPRADVKAEAAFYKVLFGWNLDELEAYRK